MRTPASKDDSKHHSDDTERTLPESSKSLVTWFVVDNESIRLTNGLIALTTRVLTSGVRILSFTREASLSCVFTGAAAVPVTRV